MPIERLRWCVFGGGGGSGGSGGGGVFGGGGGDFQDDSDIGCMPMERSCLAINVGSGGHSTGGGMYILPVIVI